MAILDQRSKQADSQGYDCPKYVAQPNSKRCRHYGEGGVCTLADEFKCVLWLKANDQPVPVDHPVAPTDLFGKPIPSPPERPDQPSNPSTSKVTESSPGPADPASAAEPKPAEQIPEGDIESFKALGVEVCIHSDPLGDVWLVPEYTDKQRKEISVEDAATLRLIVDTFPGSTVTAFDKLQRERSSTTEKDPG